MSLNNITFIKNRGGLGTPLPGRDYISGLVFYSDVLPSGYTASSPIQQLYSLQDAEDKGILSTYVDEVRATGSFTVSGTASVGDTLTVYASEPNGNYEIGKFTALGTASATASAADLAIDINSKTINTGYSATVVGAVLTVQVRKGLGIYPNTKTFLTSLPLGGLLGVSGTFSGGVASIQAIWHYHISEFFRIQPKGILFVGIFPVPVGPYIFSELATLQVYANGDIRQTGIYKTGTEFSTADITAIQAVLNTLESQKQPMSVLFAPSINATANISSLVDLSPLSGNKVSVVISQDAGGKGYELYLTTNKTISNLGNLIGVVSLSQVQENIGWVGKFNNSDGLELEAIGFGNGQRFVDVSESTLSIVNDRRYVFLRKFPNLVGSYYNDSHTAIVSNSDYAYIERNRVIDKAIRGVYLNLLPLLNSPLTLNADGTLSNATVAYLESQASISINEMVRKGEVSAAAVSIDPAQDVLTTSEVVVTITLIPIGTARNIIVNIGYSTKL